MTIHEAIEAYLKRGREMMDQACKAVFLLGYTADDCMVQTRSLPGVTGSQRDVLIVRGVEVFQVETTVQHVAMSDSLIISHEPSLISWPPLKRTTCLMLSRFADGETSEAESEQFREHLANCVTCQGELSATMQLRARLSALR